MERDGKVGFVCRETKRQNEKVGHGRSERGSESIVNIYPNERKGSRFRD